MSFPRRCVVHLDVDAFFASVEQRDDPRLRRRPVAVGTGVVASCSYEARPFGVRTGMWLAQARQLCPELIVLPGAYPRYEQAARRILAIAKERTPQVEMAALDDLYLELAANSPLEREMGTLQEVIREEVQLSVSLGSGSNKLVARVATNQAKPGRHVHVAAGGERVYLAPWPVRVLPGVGAVTAARLDRLNVQQVGEVAAMPAPLLRCLFGRRRGTVLHAQAQGIDHRPVKPCQPQHSVGRRASFEPPVAEQAFLEAMLDYLLERACSWLRFQALATRGLSVTIRYGDYQGVSGRATFRQPVDNESLLQEAARERLWRLYQRRLPLRFLGVELSPLQPCPPPPTLLADADSERARRLLQVKDDVRRRFGFTSLLSGTALTLATRLERDRENFRLRTPCLSR